MKELTVALKFYIFDIDQMAGVSAMAILLGGGIVLQAEKPIGQHQLNCLWQRSCDHHFYEN